MTLPAAAAVRFGRGFRRSGRDTPSWGFITPLVVVLAASTLFPLGYAIYLSFFNWNWGSTFSFVGLDNYAALLANAAYWASLARTLAFTAMAVTLEIVLGLALALVVHRAGRHTGWLRTVFIIPLMVSGIAVALVWKVLLDPTIGVIPRIFAAFGLEGLNLLGDPALALPTISGLDAWWQTGFVFIILNAGLQALPREPFEAAEVDGASAWQRFRFLTLPMLLPLIATVAGIRAIDCMKVFALVFGTTGGGPGDATESTQMLAYRTAFKGNQMSTSMTMMVVYALLIVAIVGIVLLTRRWRQTRA